MHFSHDGAVLSGERIEILHNCGVKGSLSKPLLPTNMGNGQSGEAKKRKRKKDTSNKNKSQATIEEDDGKSIETTTILANSPDKDKGVPLNPLTEKVMQELVNRTTTLGIAGLRNEWINVAGHIPPNLHSELFEHNTQRNAPGSNPCIDCTRVQLHLEVPPQTEYIHANWVVSSHADLPRMIMTQGPLDQTVTDFWRMVYQEKVRTIVMLCDKYENGRRIVAQYWPPRVGDANTYGQVRVQLNSNVTPDNESAYTKWNLTVSYRNQAALTTHLYCIKKWPVELVPESTFALMRLVRHVMADQSTICVHGAAGAGRPGTFVAVMVAMRALMLGRVVNVQAIAMELREQRIGAIQTEIQYLYIYRVLCEYISRKGLMKKEIDVIVKQFEAYKKEYYVHHKTAKSPNRSGP